MVRILLNRGFNIARHEYLKPGLKRTVAFEAINKKMGLRFKGSAKNGDTEKAFCRFTDEAMLILSGPE